MNCWLWALIIGVGIGLVGVLLIEAALWIISTDESGNKTRRD